jgi:hypothetical protein
MLIVAAFASLQVLAGQAIAEDGGRRGGGGGGPLPVLGLTLLGQAGGAAGIFAAWRKRNRKKQK